MSSSNKLNDEQRVERLPSEIADDLQMERDSHEKMSDWYGRVAYSALGRIALVSLWDVIDDQADSIPTDYFRQNIEKHVGAFNHLFGLNFYGKKVSSDLLKVYLQGGLMYQKGDRLVPSMEKKISYQNVELFRSTALNKKVQMSGLGFYRNIKVGTSKEIDLVMKFLGITSSSLQDVYQDLVDRAEWQLLDQQTIKKYRFLDDNSQQRKWIRTANKQKNSSQNFSILWDSESDYWLYFIEDEKFYVSHLPLPLYNNSEQKIVDSIMQHDDSLTKIKYVINEKFAKVKLMQKLPPREQLFFNMYSWQSTSMLENKQGTMTLEIFLVFHKMMKHLGYKFIKVNSKKYDTF